MVQAFGVFLQAPFAVFCALTGNLAWLIGGLLFWGLFKGFYEANIFASVFDVIRPEARGTATASGDYMFAMGTSEAPGSSFSTASSSQNAVATSNAGRRLAQKALTMVTPTPTGIVTGLSTASATAPLTNGALCATAVSVHSFPARLSDRSVSRGRQ